MYYIVPKPPLHIWFVSMWILRVPFILRDQSNFFLTLIFFIYFGLYSGSVRKLRNWGIYKGSFPTDYTGAMVEKGYNDLRTNKRVFNLQTTTRVAALMFVIRSRDLELSELLNNLSFASHVTANAGGYPWFEVKGKKCIVEEGIIFTTLHEGFTAFVSLLESGRDEFELCIRQK